MTVVLAALPPAVALLLLLARSGPVWAAVGALSAAAVLAWLGFPTSPAGLRDAAIEIAPLCVEVTLILLGGVLLNELLTAAGAQQRLGAWVAGLCREPARAVVLVVLGVTPFAESVTGFGIGAVVAVPLLRQLDFPAFRSAVLGLLGLVIVPWGALAPGTLVAARLAGLDFQALGVRSALLSLPVFLVVGAAAVLIAVGRRSALAALPDVVFVGGALWAGVLAVNATVGTPLAGALGSLAGIGAGLLLARCRDGASLSLPPDVRRCLAPYGVLVGGSLAARTLTAAGDSGGAWWTDSATSPATWLLLTCAATPYVLGRPRPPLGSALRAGLRHWWPVAVATVAFLALGALMATARMSETLAHASAGLGPAYPALAPWIGALGGFLTGSNTGANAMFAASQAEAARAIGYPVLALVTFQNVSASLATMASVPRVALAVSLARDGSAGVDSGRVLRTVLAVDMVVLVSLSGIAVLLPGTLSA